MLLTRRKFCVELAEGIRNNAEMNTPADQHPLLPDLAAAIVATSVPVGVRDADGATILYSPVLASAISRMQANLEKQESQAKPPGPH